MTGGTINTLGIDTHVNDYTLPGTDLGGRILINGPTAVFGPAFVVLKHGQTPSEELRSALLRTVRQELGAVAVIGELNFVAMLPKTRSGKIMRRVLKAVVLNVDPGDITTIEDEGSVDEARAAWAELVEAQGLRPKA